MAMGGRVLLILLIAAPACTRGAGTAATVDESRLAPIFDAIGDRIGADLRAATLRPRRSRVGAVEDLALASPAGFFRYADVFQQNGIGGSDMAGFAEKNPEVMGRMAQRLVSRTAAPLDEFSKRIATLPGSERDDCLELARRVVVLRASKGPEHNLVTAMTRGLVECVALVPVAMTCLGAAPDVGSYDSCLREAPQQ